ncbi:MAG: response regulator [Planctomycetes bacterium]|nr:response regulator [Planctomycetota bacterium]
MSTQGKLGPILVADDSADDRLLLGNAFARSGLCVPLHFVEDGQAVLDYLRGRETADAGVPAPRPSMILLDLNMPRKDGRCTLAELKADREFRSIPVVILTNSAAEEDVFQGYDLGASSYIRKPTTFEELVAVSKKLHDYWFETVQLPAATGGRRSA